MKKEKKPLDSLTKTKLIIQGEYLVISIVFLVLAILRLTGIYGVNEIRAHIFNIITLCGGIWAVVDFIWSSVSKKRRAKVTYLDKVLAFPLGIYLIIYNLISLILWNNVNQWYQYGISVVFIYAFLIFFFEAVYHWFYPTKAVLKVVEEEEKEKQEELRKSQEEKKD